MPNHISRGLVGDIKVKEVNETMRRGGIEQQVITWRVLDSLSAFSEVRLGPLRVVSSLKAKPNWCSVMREADASGS